MLFDIGTLLLVLHDTLNQKKLKRKYETKRLTVMWNKCGSVIKIYILCCFRWIQMASDTEIELLHLMYKYFNFIINIE